MSAQGAAVARVVSALREKGRRVEPHGTGSYMAQCPADGHDDRKASLSVAQGDVGAVLCCQAGCDTRDVLAALGLSWPDLFEQPQRAKDRSPRRVVAQYRYTDEAGELLFTKLRYEPKNFGVRRPDGKGGWAYKLGDARRVLYRLPEVIAAVRAGRPVFVVEGEKDADRLAAEGHTATCNFDGASDGQRTKWRPEYGDVLRGADVVIIADRDTTGIAHAKAAAADLTGKAKSVVITLPAVDREHADVSDHLDAGFEIGDLVPLPPADSVAAAPSAQEDEGDSGRGPSQAAILAKLAEEHYRLLMSDDGRPYAVKKAGPNIAVLLRGRGALRAQLARLYADAYAGRVPSASALADALTVLDGRAADKDPEPVYLRLAHQEDRIIVDLGASDGRCVVVGPDSWTREPRSPVLFRRTNLTSPIPDPVRDGDGLDKLRELMNTEEKEFRLIVAWLVSALIPEIPHPIMALHGEQGSAKSSTAQMLVDLIDPSPAPLRSVPRDMKQWAVTASASWAVALDNVSTIPGWLSDTLCKAVTGDGYVDRVLYSDDDVTVLAFRRAIIMTSIDPGSLAGDLAERLLIAELQPILDTKRRPEAEVRAAFTESRPAILASLLDLLARVLVVLPGVDLKQMPRMADFARILAAVDKVQEWTTLKDYLNATKNVAADVIDGDPFARAVIGMADHGWQGTATELLAAIKPPDPRPKDWPKDATRAAGKLKRIATELRKIGVEVTEGRSTGRDRTRWYKIERASEPPPESSRNTASAASTASETLFDQQQRADAKPGASVRNVSPSVRTLRPADTADAGADTSHALASEAKTAPEQRKYTTSDAADAADAEIRQSSEDYPDDWPPVPPADGEFWAGEEWSA
ncbi:MAG TPA: hypothetical protein VFB06_29560 [Streptosporangiaceae bacterium]|nr:hypothetical protein [Streptosporangiaceae bacterium]